MTYPIAIPVFFRQCQRNIDPRKTAAFPRHTNIQRCIRPAIFRRIYQPVPYSFPILRVLPVVSSHRLETSLKLFFRITRFLIKRITGFQNSQIIIKQKWLESMKQAPKVDVVSLGITRVSRTGDLKRIVFDANLQTTKVGAGVVESTPMKRYISVIEENGVWRIEGFYKIMPDDDK